MLISKRSYNFIKILLFFAFSAKRSFAIKEISERLDISVKVLEQALLSLKNKGILISKRGPQGGYTLARDISSLSMADIMEKAGQKVCIMPPHGGRKKELIDEVLDDIESSLEGDISSRLKKIRVRDIVMDMNERIGEDGLNYII